MILIRNVFHLKFGKAKEAMKLIEENKKLLAKYETTEARFLTDITGPFYTLVMEFTAKSLSDYEKSAAEMMKSTEFGAWYQKIIPLVESGSREIYSIVG